MRRFLLAVLVCLGGGSAFADSFPECHQPICHQAAREDAWPEAGHEPSDAQRLVLSSFSLVISDQWERMEVLPFYALMVDYGSGRQLVLEVHTGEGWWLSPGGGAAAVTPTAADQIELAFSATPDDVGTASGGLKDALRRAMALKSLVVDDARALAFMRSAPYAVYWALASDSSTPDRMFVTRSGASDEFLWITASGFEENELRAVIGSLLQRETR